MCLEASVVHTGTSHQQLTVHNPRKKEEATYSVQYVYLLSTKRFTTCLERLLSLHAYHERFVLKWPRTCTIEYSIVGHTAHYCISAHLSAHKSVVPKEIQAYIVRVEKLKSTAQIGLGPKSQANSAHVTATVSQVQDAWLWTVPSSGPFCTACLFTFALGRWFVGDAILIFA